MRSPVAIDFDEDGRVYVAEFPEYNQSADTKPDGKGCVRLLEDTDGDGVFDKSKVFASEVPMATAVACWDGGVYTGSSRPTCSTSKTPMATARPMAPPSRP